MSKFIPQRSERLSIGLMEDTYSFHVSLWSWWIDDKGYLVVEKKNK